IANGRYFTEGEVNNGLPVAIIGHTLAENLFDGGFAEGKPITVKKKKYKVIGVVEKQGESLFGNQFDNLVIVPLKCAAQHIRLNSNRNNSTIEAKAKAGVNVDLLEEELRGFMRVLRKLKPGQEEN